MLIRNITSGIITLLLGIAGQNAAAAAPQCGTTPQLDHFLLAVPDLAKGAVNFEKQTGIKPVFGGVHSDGSTANYLVRLDTCLYLEIIGPNPDRKAESALSKMFSSFNSPTLVGFAVSTTDLQAAADSVAQQDLTIGPFEKNGRITPAGDQLAWETIFLPGPFGQQLLSFFTDWQESKHPTINLIGGLQLENFSLAGPQASKITAAFKTLGVELDVKKSADNHLAITLSTPKGPITYSSPSTG